MQIIEDSFSVEIETILKGFLTTGSPVDRNDLGPMREQSRASLEEKLKEKVAEVERSLRNIRTLAAEKRFADAEAAAYAARNEKKKAKAKKTKSKKAKKAKAKKTKTLCTLIDDDDNSEDEDDILSDTDTDDDEDRSCDYGFQSSSNYSYNGPSTALHRPHRGPQPGPGWWGRGAGMGARMGAGPGADFTARMTAGIIDRVGAEVGNNMRGPIAAVHYDGNGNSSRVYIKNSFNGFK